MKRRGDANTWVPGERNSSSAAAFCSPRCYGCPKLRLVEGRGLWKLAGLEVWRCPSAKTGQNKLLFPQQLPRYGTQPLPPCKEKRRRASVTARPTSEARGRRRPPGQQRPGPHAPAGPHSALPFRTPEPRLLREAAGRRPTPGHDAAEGTWLRGAAARGPSSSSQALLFSEPRGLPTRGATASPTPRRRCPALGCASSAPPQTHRNTPSNPSPPLTLQSPSNHRPLPPALTHLL